ncbi:hypothetical protein EVAR_25234_1 [Eumeta japonica]|uniref:Uncharacterized protein n=1 Tax=Eumeta variegata TaxID=151549 RepID=A0A4C1WK58_EUMVA|nr:hypothetical protein EVAR_25234_1 [Eumeta japonica]
MSSCYVYTCPFGFFVRSRPETHSWFYVDNSGIGRFVPSSRVVTVRVTEMMRPAPRLSETSHTFEVMDGWKELYSDAREVCPEIKSETRKVSEEPECPASYRVCTSKWRRVGHTALSADHRRKREVLEAFDGLSPGGLDPVGTAGRRRLQAVEDRTACYKGAHLRNGHEPPLTVGRN